MNRKATDQVAFDEPVGISSSSFEHDLTAGLVVFVVALPLCLGVAFASNAPLFSGLLAGIVGGIVVGYLSRSHTSVSGPSPAVAATVAAQIAILGSFEAFLLAVLVSGVMQILLGLLRAGFIAAFFPSSVIKGLLAAIGVILILKQIPHVVGHDTDPEGEMSFSQMDHENTLSELVAMLRDLHPGAAAIGIGSIAILILWNKFPRLKKSIVPAPLVAVLWGVCMNLLFQKIGSPFAIESSHLVQVPVVTTFSEFCGFLKTADFSRWSDPAIYAAAMSIMVVTTLETLLNLEAVDKLDPQQRKSPPNRELVAQGVGNILLGLIGGMPMSSVIVRSSVNINAGGRTKLATIIHGCMLLVCVVLLPTYLNLVPLSALAAILLVTGFKLASPKLVKKMWKEGRNQFLPFALTVIAIVLTDLITGILIGLTISIAFILNSNLRRPVRRIIEKHLSGEVLHFQLASQVSFLNRAALEIAFDEVPRGGHVLFDVTDTVYIDPDILSLISEFKDVRGPARGVHVSLRGFQDMYNLNDEIQYLDYSTQELQQMLSAEEVLQILKDGNERFRTGHRLTRDLGRQIQKSMLGQHPLAVILSCIDSRTPSELIFDLGLGDVFNVRIAGNVVSRKILGSLEYATSVAGAKLIVVIGHTQCGAIKAAVNLTCSPLSTEQATNCQHLEPIFNEIRESIDMDRCQKMAHASVRDKEMFANNVARRNVMKTVEKVVSQSRTIGNLVAQGKVKVVGAIYNISTNQIDFLPLESMANSTAVTADNYTKSA